MASLARKLSHSFHPDSVTRLTSVPRVEDEITRPDHARAPTAIDLSQLEESGMRPITPRVVGAYRLSSPIGSGGMATVHLGVRDDDATRLYAIKRLHAHMAAEASFVEMLLDEATIGARIRHENVVAVHGATMIDGDVLVVMDYVAGVSLGDLIKEVLPQRIPARFVASIMAGALRGLHAAHEALDDQGCSLDIVHRDVSPQNIHVGIDGLGRVLDFGIAKATYRFQKTGAGELKGKIAYMAPEQLQGKPVDRRTDVRAAAVVLWEALVGAPLFHAEDAGTSVVRVIDNKVQRPSERVTGIPRALAQIVMRALAKRPEDRFATALEMAEALEALFASNPVRPSEIGAWLSAVAAEPLREQWRLRTKLVGPPSEPMTKPLASVRTLPSIAPTSPLVDEDDVVTIRRVSRFRQMVATWVPLAALFVTGATLAAVAGHLLAARLG